MNLKRLRMIARSIVHQPVRCLVLPIAALVLGACTTVVRPPVNLSNPATVVLLTHGKSSSLVLPAPQGAVRWAFGDWRYYAEGKSGPYESVAAVLWPTRGALGRQSVDVSTERVDELRAAFGIGIDEAYAIRVEREAVAALHARLQALFDSGRATLLYNPGPRLEFIHHPHAYTVFNSSNRKVAAWLRELGVSTSGITLLSRWEVEPAAFQNAR